MCAASEQRNENAPRDAHFPDVNTTVIIIKTVSKKMAPLQSRTGATQLSMFVAVNVFAVVTFFISSSLTCHRRYKCGLYAYQAGTKRQESPDTGVW